MNQNSSSDKPDSIQNKKLFRVARQLLSFNFRAFLGFKTLYALLGGTILLPLLACLFKLCLNLCGQHYLAPNNLVTLLTSPFFWIWVLLAVVLLVLYTFVDVCACILMCEMSRRSQKASVLLILKTAIIRAKTVFFKGYRLYVLLMALALPVTNILLVPSFLCCFKVPDFIIATIAYNPLYIVLTVLVFLLLFLLAVFARFSLHFFVLDKTKFKDSLGKSAQLGKGYHLKDVLFCLVLELLFFVIAAAIVAVLLLIILFVGRLFQQSGFLSQLVQLGISSALLVALALIALITLTCFTPLCYAFLSTLFYHHNGIDLLKNNGLNTAPLQARPSKAKRGITIGASIALYLLAVVITFFYFRGVEINQEDYSFTTSIVAHRCGANYAPENTVAALNKAADMGVTWCEIDAQQLADGTIIVMHDSNFSRTTGLDANTWEVTYDQVKTLDAGSSFSSEYAGEPVPTLEQMIVAAKARGMKLQIEIKPTGYDEGIEQRVIDIVKEQDYEDQCLLASQNFDCIQKIRACDVSAPILYIMVVAWGDVASISEVNSYSVEATWASSALEENVHSKSDAILCAWTVNSEYSIERCISNGVDQLVTDDIELAQELIAQAHEKQTLLLNVLSIFHSPTQSLAVM